MEFIKALLKSKTIVFNVLVVAAAVLATLQGHEVVAQYPEVMAWVAAAVGAVNVALRFMTSVSVFDKPVSKVEPKK